MLKIKFKIKFVDTESSGLFYTIIDDADFVDDQGELVEKENAGHTPQILKFMMRKFKSNGYLLVTQDENEIFMDMSLNWNSIKYIELIEFSIH